MATVNETLAELREIAENPGAQLKAHLDAGKRVIGVGPYYVPEELVYAAGPFLLACGAALASPTNARNTSRRFIARFAR